MIQTLGENIKAIREAADLNQEQLAHKSGIPLSTIQKWERDAVSPTLRKLLPVLRALGRDPFGQSPLQRARAKSMAEEGKLSPREEWAHMAVAILFERAPTQIQDALIDKLEEWSGRYGHPPSPKVKK